MHRYSRVATLLSILLFSLTMLSCSNGGSGGGMSTVMYDHFNDGVYTDRWTIGYSSVPYPYLSESGSRLTMIVSKPAISTDVSEVDLDAATPLSGTNINIEVMVNPSQAGMFRLRLKSDESTWVGISIDSDDNPYIQSTTSSSGTVSTQTYGSSANSYNRDNILGIVKQNSTYQMYLDGALIATLENSALGNAGLILELQSISTGMKSADTYNSVDYVAVASNQNVKSYSVSGTVTSNGSGLSGVSISLNGSRTVTTDSGGKYLLRGVVNGAYTLTASKTGYSFKPTSQAITMNGQNITADFMTDAHLAGSVVAASGAGLPDVIVGLSGAMTATTKTDAQGNFSFAGLANGDYTITPSLEGYTFNPTSSVQTISGWDVVAVPFTQVTPLEPTYRISGGVLASGMPLSGVLVLLNGPIDGTMYTDATGKYLFTGLSNGNYTVTPTRSDYIITPESRTVALSGADVTTGMDFEATLSSTNTVTTHAISGTVTVAGGALDAVTITLSGAADASTTTDSNGYYIFPGLHDGSYTVTPSRSGFTFTPSSTSCALNGVDLTAVNFSTAGYSSAILTGPWILSGTGMDYYIIPDGNGGITESGVINGTTGSYSLQANGAFTITLNRSTGGALTFAGTMESSTGGGFMQSGSATIGYLMKVSNPGFLQHSWTGTIGSYQITFDVDANGMITSVGGDFPGLATGSSMGRMYLEGMDVALFIKTAATNGYDQIRVYDSTVPGRTPMTGTFENSLATKGSVTLH